MFSLKRLCLALPLLGLLASCSEEIEVAAPYRPVTVIYGLLDISDTAQYIRIQKAFLDENKSAIQMAQVADSNFYSSLDVHFQDFNSTSLLNASTLVADETLSRVDLNAEGYTKESGAFFNTPSFAYKTRRPLLSGHTYRLIVNNSQTGESDTAQTPIIGNSSSDFYVNEFTPILQVAFPAIRAEDLFRLTLRPPVNSQIYEGIVRFHYVDKEGSKQTDRSFDYRFATVNRSAVANSIELSNTQRSFYGVIRDAMGPAGTNVQRYMDSCDLIVWAGGKDLFDYQTINNAQGGLTADQIKPIYTNIRGKNAYGLFSTRTKVVRPLAPISDQTLDSLVRSPTMASVNIQGRSDH